MEGFVTTVVDKERARELCCYFVGWRCVIRGWGEIRKRIERVVYKLVKLDGISFSIMTVLMDTWLTNGDSS